MDRQPGTSSMRMLFVIPAYFPFVGGAQTFVEAMAHRLVQDGHHVTILTTGARSATDFWLPPKESPLAQTAQREGVQIIRLPLRYPWPAPYRFGLWRRLGHWLQRTALPDHWQKPLLSHLARSMPPVHSLQLFLAREVAQADLVHVIDATWDGLFVETVQAAERAKKPVIAVPLMHTGSPQILAHFLMAHQLAAYQQVAAVGTLSQAEAKLLVAQGVNQQRISVLPMGVEAHKINVSLAFTADQYGWYNPERLAIAFLGAATFDKGAFTLVHALLALRHQGLDVDLLCAGPLQSTLQAMVASLPVADQQWLRSRIHWLGIVDEDEKEAMLSAAHLLALPSRVDAFGIAILEAWCHGKPVVAATEGGLVETVSHGVNGLLVPFDDVAALADALAQLLLNPDLAAQLGKAGRETVQARYTWDHTYETLCAIYEQIDATGSGHTRSSQKRHARRHRHTDSLSPLDDAAHRRANPNE